MVMNRDIAKALWTSLALVGLVLTLVIIAFGAWKIFELIRDSLGSTVISKGRVLQSIEHVNKQIFVQHNIVIDVTYEDAPKGWLSWLEDLGVKQEFVVLVWGRVPAGFDLQQLDEDSIWISADGKRVQLTLPPPMIFEENVSIDFDKSRVFSEGDTCPEFLCKDTLEAYQQEALPEAVDRMVEAAYQYGILEQAARDGKAYYEQSLRSMGFEQVQVVISGHDL